MTKWFNLDAILYSPWARVINQSLMIPHFLVKDLNNINPYVLKKIGFKGIICDKDNTLTAPYELEIFPTIKEVVEECKDVFKENFVIMSNSAGTNDDKNYLESKLIESTLGINVLRHSRKKPGGINSVLDYYGKTLKKSYNTSELVMVGDRILTDIVFGNRYCMLTINTALLTEKGDINLVTKFRQKEMNLVKKLMEEGKNAPLHKMYNKNICSNQLV